MKKLMLGLSLVLAMGLVANVAFTDETVPFPFWQHGWNLMSFWSVANAEDASTGSAATVTITLLQTDGTVFGSTTGTVQPGTAWQPATYDAWYSFGDGYGYGTYAMDTAAETCDHDAIYLWGAIFAVLSDSTPGYTVVMPGNPYGVPGC